MNYSEIMIKETTEEDLDNIMTLWNNGEVMKYVGFPEGLGITKKELENWYKYIINKPYRCHYSIYTDELGYCGENYYNVDVTTGYACLDIKLLPHAQGKGIGYRGLSYAIEKAFKEGKAIAVYVDPHPDNKSAWKLYEKLGFMQTETPHFIETTHPYLELTYERWLELNRIRDREMYK